MKIDDLQQLLEEERQSVKKMDEQLTNAKTRWNNLKLEKDELKTENKSLKAQICDKLESVDVKNHVETENECRDEAVIETVIDVIRSTNDPSTRKNAAITLARLAKDPGHMVKIRELRGMEILMTLGRSIV